MLLTARPWIWGRRVARYGRQHNRQTCARWGRSIAVLILADHKLASCSYIRWYRCQLIQVSSQRVLRTVSGRQ